MDTQVVTVSLKKEAIDALRAMSDNKKGFLGKAISEAITAYVAEKKGLEANERLRKMLNEGFDMGGVTYSHRSELYER
ncbi:MAG: CRISPR/Cas system CMR-associated protein Cmr5 small subunit [Patescibacteria group bacterium]|jgi:CRISPR/Cas system CMR-associated protein Cmr5 small subunit